MEISETRLPRPSLKAKISPAKWTVWSRAWDSYSTYSCMEAKGLAVQLWQCLADTTRSELRTLGLKSYSGLETLLEAAKESILGKIIYIAQQVAFCKLLQYETDSIRTFLGRLQEAFKWYKFSIAMEAKCGALVREEAEEPCGTVMKHRACYQEHVVLTQLMAGLRS